jgi:hypothetical protein
VTFTCRLIAPLLFATLLFLAAPFSLAGEHVTAPETAVAAVAETGQVDKRIALAEADGQPRQDAPAVELQAAEADAQECALLVAGSWSAPSVWTAAMDATRPSLPSPALAALDRPPRGR